MGSFVPNGSYVRSCFQITVKLTCQAWSAGDDWVPASFDLTNAEDVQLLNENGVLKPAPESAPPTGFIPAGSYKLTCKDIHVTLACQAEKIDGSYIDATFDLTHVPAADLWNDNGILKNAYKTLAIYVPGPFYQSSGGIEPLMSSNFNTVIAWAFHVEADGSIFNEGTVVKGGKYVGDLKWAERLHALKGPTSSVRRILFSLWGEGTFSNIQNLIWADGPGEPQTGPGTPLYENFRALKAAMPAVDGIDLDNESLYDTPTTVAFSRMLGVLGYQVTFCTYTDPSFWCDSLQEVHERDPQIVAEFNLQCYSGGGGNNPQDWVDAIERKMAPGFHAESFVFPGVGINYGAETPEKAREKFAYWSKRHPLAGGFLWKADEIPSAYTLRQFADAMRNGLNA
ncbi:hypothetical protein HL667_30445 [Bradyrhizobium sp. 83012]|uniref:GH18 domain-containing protein n=1 Tax=Bradyrhizobium aeschynomenes TaxID=2734909 RepID=A0ABX2CME2_9BRAD|nr:hypothetical protein [Bradyrhizobium aeschynomenes]NPU69359.1 hypothetical protein [Bradyrhizobium aeschynomenes]NPV25745.1 hypothetical protein [Bradyrhizobium aeschynomenes]